MYEDVKAKMDKAIAAMESDFAGIRAGRANPAILDKITVDYYGTATPLAQVGTISVPDPRQLLIQPWDASILRDIEKAMKKITEKGLKLRISELDIEISQNVEQSHRYQADRYANLMKLYTKYAEDILAVQVWGVTDDLSWKADKYPLLFDRNVQPKPAFHALIENVVK